MPRTTPEEIAASMVDRTLGHSDALKELINIVDQVPQLEIPVTHRFYTEKGEYWREITMPSGMTGVGHIHRHRHLNLVLSGHALVTWDGQTHEVKAPAIFYSEAGAQKAFQVFEDFRLVTIHPNPDNLTDVLEIEQFLFQLEEEQVQSGLSIDEFRMQKNQLLKGKQ
jgi:quercetin dioxygenase-like cupin family protein